MTTKRLLRAWIAASLMLAAAGGLSNAAADNSGATRVADKTIGTAHGATSIDMAARPSTTAAIARHHQRRNALQRSRARPTAVQVAYRSMPEIVCSFGWCRAPFLLILGVGY